MKSLKCVATFGLLSALATGALAQIEPPYYANLSFLPPRTLSNWSNLTVETQTGTFIGMYNDSYPDVRQFLRIPYAKPPIGDLRFMPPVAPENSSKKYDSTYYGPSCAQFVGSTLSFYNEYEPPNPVLNIGEYRDQGDIAWSSAEDCLSLAVWTPAYANKSSNLPVALFVTGGGGVTGGIYIPAQLPSPWVSRSQEHIVVTINYRLNIFGNPMSRALNDTSLSLLDVRAAAEWVRENIAAFGGDPDNIMLWGQSQGAMLTHLYTLAFPDDPVAAKFGVISEPGPQVVDTPNTPTAFDQFDFIAKTLGCNYGDDYDAELACMQGLSFVQLEQFIGRYNATQLSWRNYLSDDKYIFYNETQRYLEGKVAKRPSVRSDAAREMTSTNATAVDEGERVWDCYALSDSKLRAMNGLETYRYYWAGNFTNISPVPWLGAFHFSDLYMIFGTYHTDVGPISQLEIDTSAIMQDYLLAYMKDVSTVTETVGWPAFNASAPDGGTIVLFGNQTAVRNATGDWIDAGCYDPSVGMVIDGS